MLSKNQKRLIVIIIAVVVSAYIWHVNRNLFHNRVKICLIMSTTTFLIIFTPFEIYFSFRDIWYDRWVPLNLKYLEISKVKIEVEVKRKKKKFIHADMISLKDKESVKAKNTIIIISHGFSDTKNTLQCYSFPLAYQGYIILAYDARGTGKSKRTGRRSHFLKRIEDFKKIIEWIKSRKELSGMKINCMGFSIGAITVLCGGFANNDIDKIIAISSMSYYRQNIPKFNPIIILSYLFKGVKLFPNYEENKRLSPSIVIKEFKKEFLAEDWEKSSKRVMLIHCKNDRIIKFKNFLENKLILESPERNLLILRKGGHSQKKNECAIVGSTLNFLKS